MMTYSTVESPRTSRNRRGRAEDARRIKYFTVLRTRLS